MSYPGEREQQILKYIVQSFIETGSPIGSRFVSKQCPVDLSAASIRNIMADLEEQGYLSHPHTSAGRVPTDKAYRAYVDAMIDRSALSSEEKNTISSAVFELAHNLSRISEGVDEILYHSSKALAKISNELGIILSPQFNQSVFDKLRLTTISRNRVLIELSLRSGIVKTVVLEVLAELGDEHLTAVAQLLNERLSGLTIGEIRTTLGARVRDLRYRFEDQEDVFIRVFLDSAQQLFNFEGGSRIRFAGANNILSKPDFADRSDVQTMFQMLEEKDGFARMFINRTTDGVLVTIGREHANEQIAGYSIITANYRMGDSKGTVGIIGPKRMPYDKLIPLVEHTAGVLERVLNG